MYERQLCHSRPILIFPQCQGVKMKLDYETYSQSVKEDIANCLESMGCQPILFIGSGFSKRYFGGPNWEELLQFLASACPKVPFKLAYYKQDGKSPIDIGEIFAGYYKEWAWSEGQSKFPEELFAPDKSPQLYVKYYAAKYLDSMTPDSLESISNPDLANELRLLRQIQPHSIITTNYDMFLERVFPDYLPIIGQQILKANNICMGEIFKIHGCTSDPSSIVLTKQDYDTFISKKKYLSAKLLTFFAEHPLLFLGYRAGDPNIKAILSDIDEILSPQGGLIPNIYILKWDPRIAPDAYPAFEEIVDFGQGNSIRIKSITANSFDWVYEAFGVNPSIKAVNVKLLRALVARTYELARCDIPRKTMDFNYEVLEKVVNSGGELARLYGVTFFSTPTSANIMYPYSITQISNSTSTVRIN